ncbi:MAG: toll/interleukin-1 receptor domain-containing protein [Bacilli bacterium]|nr:toll/interleukin-1 receptor domain-containing protein [Bacilli bacterium]
MGQGNAFNPNEPYFFISYSHANMSAIDGDLLFFDREKFNYWIDREGMSGGDSWKRRAEKAISDPLCKGALCYLSLDALQSDAIEFELGLILRQLKDREVDSFKAVPVIFGKNTIPDFILFAMRSHIDVSETRESLLREVFPEEVLSIGHDKADYETELRQTLRSMGIVKDREAFMATHSEAFGRYYSPKVSKRVILGGVEEFFYVGEELVFRDANKEAHEAFGLHWLPLAPIDNHTMLAVCAESEALDSIRGDTIDEWLARFEKIAFSEEERAQLVPLADLGFTAGERRYADLLTFEQIKRYKDLIFTPNSPKEYWLKDVCVFDGVEGRHLNVMGNHVNEYGRFRRNKSGVRPVVYFKM